jgi:hypothetical protein
MCTLQGGGVSGVRYRPAVVVEQQKRREFVINQTALCVVVRTQRVGRGAAVVE